MTVNLFIFRSSLRLLYRVHPLPTDRGFIPKVIKPVKDTFCRHLSDFNLGHFSLDPPELDYNYLCNPINSSEIASNISRRKAAGNIEKVHELFQQVQKLKEDVKALESQDLSLSERLKSTKLALISEARKIPNQAHPDVFNNKSDAPVSLKTVGSQQKFDFEIKQFHELAENLDLLQTGEISWLVGPKGYYLKGELAELEQALVDFTMDCLLQEGFCPVSVPDLLHSAVIEGCGMETRGHRTQVYHLNTNWGTDVCLAGTSEMALAGLFSGKAITESQLPCRLAAVSRCYRAEVSQGREEKTIGLYRVHEFTKVEMFAVTPNRTGKESTDMLNEFVTLQQSLFSKLGLHFKVLDMPLSDLGPSAYRKYDIEAWLPGRKVYGEISSTSNCTDYQSRRLHIKYQPSSPDGNTGLDKKFAHTVNGTACAIPRMLLAIFETYQNKDGSISIPEVLVPYMHGKDVIKKNALRDNVQWIHRRMLQTISNLKL